MSIQKYATGQLIPAPDAPAEIDPAAEQQLPAHVAGCGRCGGQCGCPPDEKSEVL